MYGGGFATIPAYLRDLFGTLRVGAIHGRLLTAWSAAGVVGPLLINFMSDYQVAHGVYLAHRRCLAHRRNSPRLGRAGDGPQVAGPLPIERLDLNASPL